MAVPEESSGLATFVVGFGYLRHGGNARLSLLAQALVVSHQLVMRGVFLTRSHYLQVVVVSGDQKVNTKLFCHRYDCVANRGDPRPVAAR